MEDHTHTQCFFVKEYFPVRIFWFRHPVAINVKTGMPPFGILANHKIKMCRNSVKKNNDTKDYSEQLEFLNSEPYYASKKNVLVFFLFIHFFSCRFRAVD